MNLTYIKNGETLRLEESLCTGCGGCVDVCPHAVFSIEEGKALIRARGRCMECGACARNCPFGALSVQAGVGCAAAIIIGKIRGTAPVCGGEDSGDAGACCAPTGKRSRKAAGSCC